MTPPVCVNSASGGVPVPPAVLAHGVKDGVVTWTNQLVLSPPVNAGAMILSLLSLMTVGTAVLVTYRRTSIAT